MMPELSSSIATPANGKPQREQKRISSKLCSWLHRGQYISSPDRQALSFSSVYEKANAKVRPEVVPELNVDISRVETE